MAGISVNQISKTYAKTEQKALDRVSFSVKEGELFGLIGPDGAGKTSLFRILTTLLLPDEGSASIRGLDVVKHFRQIRRMIGYMPGKFSLYQDLSVQENLKFFATVFNANISENYALIKDIYIQLEPFKDRRAGKLSGGMKQKLALCCALIHNPQVLILDEPTTGVDAVSRKEFWEMLKRLKHNGITILVSTPYMDEASLCEGIALIQNGRILSIDSPEGLIQKFRGDLYAIRAQNMSQLLRDLRQLNQIESCNAFGDFHHIIFKINNEFTRAEVIETIRKTHTTVELKEVRPEIEDCFIQLMQE